MEGRARARFDRLTVQVFSFIFMRPFNDWFHELEPNRLNGQPVEGRRGEKNELHRAPVDW
jgi:hypothetical protein